MKKYQLILNASYENQEIIFFDRLTKNIFSLLKNNKNYILSEYEKFFKIYDVIDLKLDKKEIEFIKENQKNYNIAFISINLLHTLKENK